MNADLTIKRLREQRELWIELSPELAVCVRRPLEAEFGKFMQGVTVDHVCEYVVNWRGFSEATLLGSAHGSADPLPFDAALWSEYVRDHVSTVVVIAKQLADRIQRHLEATKADAGN
jgi:hypothetical protein